MNTPLPLRRRPIALIALAGAVFGASLALLAPAAEARERHSTVTGPNGQTATRTTTVTP
jgi:hypothetical protein